MRCEEAARQLYAGNPDPGPELEVHLSSCEECRRLAEDLSELRQAFARARAEWVPSPGFRVRLPSAPWRRLAVAAGLLLIPLFAWAALSRRPPEPAYDLEALLAPPLPAPVPSDREILATIFPEVMRP